MVAPPAPQSVSAFTVGGNALGVVAPSIEGRNNEGALEFRGVPYRDSVPLGTLVLSSGLELRLGDPGDVRLKLAIARRVLSATGGGPTSGGYVDVSVPERPVYNPNSQVGG